MQIKQLKQYRICRLSKQIRKVLFGLGDDLIVQEKDYHLTLQIVHYIKPTGTQLKETRHKVINHVYYKPDSITPPIKTQTCSTKPILHYRDIMLQEMTALIQYLTFTMHPAVIMLNWQTLAHQAKQVTTY